MCAKKAVEAIRDDLIQFTQELIRTPALTNQEGDAAKLVLAKCQEIGLDEAWVDGSGNVIGVLRGGNTGPHILLNGHLDTVPPGIMENWKHDPYGADIEKGVLFGRGVTDMLAGSSGALYALKIMKDLRDKKGVKLPGNIIFSDVMNEENATCFGAEYLMTKTLPEKGLKVDLCLLGEPTNGRLHLGHRGKVELVLITRGETAHSSTPWRGINAVQKMLPVLQDIFNRQPEELKKRTYPKLGFSSITVTNILARPGALSIVPDECEISIDRRYVPGETLQSILAEYNVLFDELKKQDPQFEARIKVRTVPEKSWTGYEKDCLKHHAVWVTPEDHPYVQMAVEALKEVGLYTGLDYWQGGTDGSLIAGTMGIPTIGFQYGDINQAHRYDEHITLKELVDTAEGYAAMLCKFMSVDLKLLDEV